MKHAHRTRPLEWVVGKCLFVLSTSVIVTLLLIFIFVGRMALPILFGETNSAAIQRVIPPGDMDKLSRAEWKSYLDLSEKQFESMDHKTLRSLMDLKAGAAREAPEFDPDGAVNTTQRRTLLLPYRWTGDAKPEDIWQPVSRAPKSNIVPLIVESLKTMFVALLVGLPLALGAALYVSQFAPHRLREWIKPLTEMLAGVPSVVIGFFALFVMARTLKEAFGYESRLHVFVAGFALSLAAIPVIFSIAEDALTTVSRSYSEAALALGASPWQTAWQVVLPAALPGVFAAVALGLGRAFGETMIVLMASGNASIMSASLFGTATVLLFLTFALNLVAIVVRSLMRKEFRSMNRTIESASMKSESV